MSGRKKNANSRGTRVGKSIVKSGSETSSLSSSEKEELETAGGRAAKRSKQLAGQYKTKTRVS